MKTNIKIVPYYLIFITLPTLGVSSPLHTSNDIRSWETVPITTFNKKIQKAHKNRLNWVSKPELYVYNLFELSGLKNISYEYSADNIESPKKIDINILRDGFLDDSIRGDIHHIKLKKSNKGIWKVISIKKTTSCWRNKQQIYSTNICP